MAKENRKKWKWLIVILVILLFIVVFGVILGIRLAEHWIGQDVSAALTKQNNELQETDLTKTELQETERAETGIQETEESETELPETELMETELSVTEEPQTEITYEAFLLSRLSLEEKVAQMFILMPEQLTDVHPVTAAGEATREALQQYPVGGLIYLGYNIVSKDQVTEMLQNTQQYSMETVGVPMFTCIDEEGGTVTRISGKGTIDVPYIDTMQSVGYGEPQDAYDTGAVIGQYLSELGFNVNFAPVADVMTNPENTVIGSRAFSSDPVKAGEMVSSFVWGLRSENVASTLKHFPGHGDTSEDSHTSCAVSYKTLDELRACEFIPFAEGIRAGTNLIMIGHISLPNVTGDYTPATLSGTIVEDILRGEMGYNGIIVTDAMNMAAITNYYSSADAAVKAICAGVDMILAPADFYSAYYGVLEAVRNGVISEERIDSSVLRILELKTHWME